MYLNPLILNITYCLDIVDFLESTIYFISVKYEIKKNNIKYKK